MKELKSNKLFYLIVIAVSLIIIFLFFSILLSSPIEVTKVNVVFSTGETTGFNVDKLDYLNFGRVVPGNSATKKVFIKNDYGFPITVKIFASKEIADYVQTDRDIYIEEGQEMPIGVLLEVPGDVNFRNYSGSLVFKIYKSEDKG
ncbi:hypothetical protein AUJ84_04265 [Candidatus Pacearchaeota archaeon CG1_02_32_132]|nr:MAG: hypothetical protein AUJ84_04265 [Candidatus Pacearchaeota archaeon CG1_02_32_132]